MTLPHAGKKVLGLDWFNSSYGSPMGSILAMDWFVMNKIHSLSLIDELVTKVKPVLDWELIYHISLYS